MLFSLKVTGQVTLFFTQILQTLLYCLSVLIDVAKRSEASLNFPPFIDFALFCLDSLLILKGQ